MLEMKCFECRFALGMSLDHVGLNTPYGPVAWHLACAPTELREAHLEAEASQRG